MSVKNANKLLLEWFDVVCAHYAKDGQVKPCTSIKLEDHLDEGIVHVIAKSQDDSLWYRREDSDGTEINFSLSSMTGQASRDQNTYMVTIGNLLETLNMMNSIEMFMLKDGLTHRLLSTMFSPRWVKEVRSVLDSAVNEDITYLDNPKDLMPLLNERDFTPSTVFLVDQISMTDENIKVLNRISIVGGIVFGTWLQMWCNISIIGKITVKYDESQIESPKVITVEVLRRDNHALKAGDRYLSMTFHVRSSSGLLAKVIGKARYVLEEQ